MKREVVVLGGSGLIGQQFIRMLEGHPFFDLVGIYASERSAGNTLKDIWRLPNFDVPEEYSSMVLEDLSGLGRDFDIAFSGLPASVAGSLEEALRNDGKYVFSNASSHRMDPDVPILIPEINAEHIEVVKKQGGDGFIITNSNCSISGVALFLNELRKIVPFQEVYVSTYQAMSGAGFAGLTNPTFSGNVVPYIAKEEEKLASEGLKILSTDVEFTPPNFSIYANCARVPVVDGHIASLSVKLSEDIEKSEVINFFQNVRSPLSGNHYVAPRSHVIYLSEDDRPQPSLDAFAGEPSAAAGMAATVGRIRVSNRILRAFVLAHNTIRGGAGGSVLNAEYAYLNNYFS